MAKAISSEELQLKKRARRRLVGAIALVLFVVVFLPMILDNEPRQMSQDIAINIPPLHQTDSAEPVSSEPLRFRPIEPSAATGQTAIAVAPQTAPAQARSVSEPAPMPRVADNQSVEQTKNTSVNNGFVVQLGAFSNSPETSPRAVRLIRRRQAGPPR